MDIYLRQLKDRFFGSEIIAFFTACFPKRINTMGENVQPIQTETKIDALRRQAHKSARAKTLARHARSIIPKQEIKSKAAMSARLDAETIDQQTRQFLTEKGSSARLAVTLQTRLVIRRGRNPSEQQWIDLQEDFHRFLSRLNYRVFGNLNRRKPTRYSLLTLPVIEGRVFSPDGNRTLHYHVAFGNLPSQLSMLTFRDLVHEEWTRTQYGKADIDISPLDRGWFDYITKESETGNVECVDWRNTFAPRHVLSA